MAPTESGNLETDLNIVFPVKSPDKKIKTVLRHAQDVLSEITTFPSEDAHRVPASQPVPVNTLAAAATPAPVSLTNPASNTPDRKEPNSKTDSTEIKSQGKSSSTTETKSDKSKSETETQIAKTDEPISSKFGKQAIKAEARLLRRGATLIPVNLEVRDIKDRIYADLPVTFQVEMKPKNFLAGHILNAYTDSPWKKTINTNSNGVAEIHMLLDLDNKEINISRDVVTTKESTVCKILITPKI
jgi:hypothetical protein